MKLRLLLVVAVVGVTALSLVGLLARGEAAEPAALPPPKGMLAENRQFEPLEVATFNIATRGYGDVLIVLNTNCCPAHEVTLRMYQPDGTTLNTILADNGRSNTNNLDGKVQRRWGASLFGVDKIQLYFRNNENSQQTYTFGYYLSK